MNEEQPVTALSTEPVTKAGREIALRGVRLSDAGEAKALVVQAEREAVADLRASFAAEDEQTQRLRSALEAIRDKAMVAPFHRRLGRAIGEIHSITVSALGGAPVRYREPAPRAALTSEATEPDPMCAVHTFVRLRDCEVHRGDTDARER